MFVERERESDRMMEITTAESVRTQMITLKIREKRFAQEASHKRINTEQNPAFRQDLCFDGS